MVIAVPFLTFRRYYLEPVPRIAVVHDEIAGRPRRPSAHWGHLRDGPRGPAPHPNGSQLLLRVEA